MYIDIELRGYAEPHKTYVYTLTPSTNRPQSKTRTVFHVQKSTVICSRLFCSAPNVVGWQMGNMQNRLVKVNCIS